MKIKRIIFIISSNILAVIIGGVSGAFSLFSISMKLWLPHKIESLKPGGEMLFGGLVWIVLTAFFSLILGFILGSILGIIIFNIIKKLFKRG